jgi:hypothetical protein
MAEGPPTEEVLRETCETLAKLLQVALTTWRNALEWLAHYVASGSDDALGELDRFARDIGLDLLTVVRLADVLRSSWVGAPRELDPRPALPLAQALGESYVLLLMVDSTELAERLPVVSMERTRELFTTSVRDWMAEHLDEVPEYQPDAGTPA